jgi:hypothetical protein
MEVLDGVDRACTAAVQGRTCQTKICEWAETKDITEKSKRKEKLMFKVSLSVSAVQTNPGAFVRCELPAPLDVDAASLEQRDGPVLRRSGEG